MANVGRAYKNWPKYDDDLVNKAYVDEATKNAEISGDLEKQISKNSEDIKTANSDIVNLRNEKLDANVYDKFIAEEYDPLASQINTTVKQVDVEYYLSDEATKLVGGEWSTEAPPWEDGKYMWSRQKVTYVDGTYITRNATCISGATGPAGENAETPETDKTFSGTETALLENSGDNILPLLNIYGKSMQKTRRGIQKLREQGLATEHTNTDFWAVNTSTLDSFMTPLEDGWVKFKATNTGTSDQIYNFIMNRKALDIEPDTEYTMILEHRNVVNNNTSGYFNPIADSASVSYFTTVATIPIKSITNGIKKYTLTSKSDLSRAIINSYMYLPTGESCEFECRMSVVEGNYTSIEYTYEPYGASPSPEFPSEIESVGYENLFKGEFRQGNILGENVNSRLTADDNYYIEKGKTYTVSTNAPEKGFMYGINTATTPFPLAGGTTNRNYDSGWQTVNKFTFTANVSGYLGMPFAKSNGTDTLTLDDIKDVWFVLSEGVQERSYIPYGKYGIEVKTIGKNLANLNDSTENADNIWNFTIGEVKANKNYSLYINVDGVISFHLKYKGDSEIIRSEYGVTGKKVINFTSTKDDSIYFNCFGSSEETYKGMTEIMLVDGTYKIDTIGEYQPYQERTSTIVLNAPLRSLPNGIKDIAYIKNNKLYVDRYVGSRIFDGSETGTNPTYINGWKLYEKNTAAERRFGLLEKTVPRDLSMLSNYFICDNQANGQLTDLRFWTQEQYWAVTDANNKWSDAATFKTWLAENNLKVIYQLNEPITETYPDVFDLRTFENCTNLFVLSNLKSDIDGKYYTPFKGDIGQSGKGVSSIIEEYSTSESNETPPISGWSTVQPKWSSEYYIWTRSKIIYKDPESIEYTEPICSTLNDAYDDLSLKINGKIESYYQNTDPSSSWSTAIEKESHVGDIWYNTSNQKTFVYYKDSSTNPVSYSWKWQNVPMELLNTVEGKSTIYSGIIPVNYKKGEYWIIPLDCYTNSYSLTSQEGTFSVGMMLYVGKYELEVLTVDSSNKIATYKINIPTKSNYSLAEVITDENITLTITSVSDFELPTDCYGGTTCVAISDGTTYNKAHWIKRNYYIPQDKAESFVSKDYVRDEILHVSSETTKQINDLDNSFGIKITTVETTIKGNKDELDKRIGGFENTTNNSIEDLQKIDSDLADKLDKEYKYLISELQVLNDKITAYIRSTGGNNLLRNAVGFKNDLYWSGDKSTYTEQEYRTYSGKTITINFRYKKTGASTSKVVLGYYVGTTFTQVYEIFNKSTAVNEWSEVEFSYTSTVNNPVIRFNGYFTAVQDNDAEANGASGSKLVFNNGLIITDLMIGYGEKQPWTPYFDEVYGKTYTIDQYGFDMIEDASSKKMHLDTNSIDFLDNNGNVEGVFSKAQTITDNITANTSFNMGNLNMIKIDNNNIIEY